ncbi:class I SAM-dependent methyltransferase [Thalassospira australica]|uniref:class I SAM-dependent methyltransferase n=1 Tax=Thalassospira australica TaxID=1528106 RepID=UPI00385081D5
MKNPIFDVLCDLGICDASAVEHFHKGVRDRDDIDVLLCQKSGALFLNRVDHMDMAYYNSKQPTHKFGTSKRQIISTNDDTQRRYNQFSNLVRGKNWLEVGAGSGAMLDVFAPLVAEYAAVEPQEQAASFLREIGHPVYQDIKDVPAGTYDVITLFHVFEHLNSPLEMLKNLINIMPINGRLIIEVPHARDMLISFAGCKSFHNHTFWSEHLFLHTRDTLGALAIAAGFKITSIQGVQRYPVSNHLYWLAKGKPAGHVTWNMLTDRELDSSYESVLAKLDLTDTLIMDLSKCA